MTVLVDWQIQAYIESDHFSVSPFDPKLINPNSLDFRLADGHKKYMGFMCSPINPYDQETVEQGLFEKTGKFVLSPGKFVLGSTVEKIRLPADICAEITGKSSVARLGIQIHQTGGWIDAGFEGQITLEIGNCGTRPVLLHPGMLIGQLVFHQTQIAKVPYGNRPGSKYQNQAGPVASKYFQNSCLR